MRALAAVVVYFLLVGCGKVSTTGGSSTSQDAAQQVGHDAGADAEATEGGVHAEASVGAEASTDASAPRDAEAGLEGAVDDADAVAAVEAGGAALTELSISPLTLVPAFSPDVHDYYVRCTAATSSLTVTMSAATGATCALSQPTATSPQASHSITVDVAENAAIVAVATAGTAQTSYWVRCLPKDFPILTMKKHPDAGAPSSGYYLIGSASGGPSSGGSYAIVLDSNAVPVWYSTLETGGRQQQVFNVESLATNDISFTTMLQATLSTTSGAYAVHDLSAATVSQVESSGEPMDMHDLQLLPNGDYLVISDKITTGVDLTGLGSYGASEDVIGCDIQEIDASGSVVWSWSAMDHFDPVQDTTYPESQPLGKTNAVDVFHCNSIDVDSSGDLLVSARQMDSIFLVSKSTKAVVWKMGGAKYTKDGATYLAVQGDPLTSFYRQHDARFQANGQVSIYDDQTGKSGPSRAVLYTYDVSAGTATFAWQYQGKAAAQNMGSFRILSDGSRIIGWGTGGGSVTFSEVTADGGDMVDFTLGGGASSYRALKVPLTQLDIGLMRSRATAQ